MKIHANITSIRWDTDGVRVKLPSTASVSVTVEDDADELDISEALANALSDMHGWCVLSFEYATQAERSHATHD